MSALIRAALGFALLRGLMLVVGTVPWARQKLRRPDATESERSLTLMIASRTALLGAVILVLWLTGRPQALGWVLVGDGGLQLFDVVLALSLAKRSAAGPAAILCVLDGLAGTAMLMT